MTMYVVERKVSATITRQYGMALTREKAEEMIPAFKAILIKKGCMYFEFEGDYAFKVAEYEMTENDFMYFN